MITIIILVHNIKESNGNILATTDKCIYSLYETATLPFELALIDNGSDDAMEAYNHLKDLMGVGNVLRQASSYVKRYEANTHISTCWNIALKETSGDFVFLVNNDIAFHQKGWMNLVVEQLKIPHNGVVGLQGMSWNIFSFIEGSFFCFRRSLIGELGGNWQLFDERFPFSCEDSDLCHRVQAAGLAIHQIINLSSYMVHEHHGTLSYADREGNSGWKNKPIQYITHDARRLLCRKWGLPEQIVD